jgi:hypothetical protein
MEGQISTSAGYDANKFFQILPLFGKFPSKNFTKKIFFVILFSGMQHGIKPFLEFSPNDRHIFRASFQNELRLNSETKLAKFTVLRV